MRHIGPRYSPTMIQCIFPDTKGLRRGDVGIAPTISFIDSLKVSDYNADASKKMLSPFSFSHENSFDSSPAEIGTF